MSVNGERRRGSGSALTVSQRITEGSDGWCHGLLLSGEVKRQQVSNIGIRCTLWQFGEHVQQVRIRLDITRAAREHQAVDHGAGLRASHCVAEEPRLSRGGIWPDVALLST